MSCGKTAYVKMKRQASPKDNPYWENFKLEYGDDDTILSLLIRLENPTNNSAPVHHKCNCKEEMCGTCSSCYDACPRTSKSESRNISPSSIAHVVTMNDYVIGRESSKKRLESRRLLYW